MAACPRCGQERPESAPGWCAQCQTGDRLGARALLDWLAPGWTDLGDVPARHDPLDWPDYPERLVRVRSDRGLDEAVLAVDGTVRDTGARAVLVAWDFGFLGGSMSGAVGQRVAAGFDHAREHGLPVVLLPSTGGARMQEGMVSLVQMPATTVAAMRHADAGLLQVTVVRDPTTGGVFASHANLADVLLAERGATVGFAGPRVAEAVTGGPLPTGSHTARGARAAGLVDDVVERPDLPRVLGDVLCWGRPAPSDGRTAAHDRPTPDEVDAWDAVVRSRDPARARTRAFLDGLDVRFELHGDRSGGDDPTLRVVLAQLAGRPIVVVALDRAADDARITPGGYRKAWRGLRLAGRLDVPVVTLIDTPGADASAASEAGGIAHHIAWSFVEMLRVRAPVVSLVIGEGGSGGALALAVGDRLLIQERAIFSVIAPEGAAAILFRDPGRAPDVARLLRPTAPRLRELGIADEVVAEPPGREVDHAWAVVARTLDELATVPADDRLARRASRWRYAGAPDTETVS